MCQSERIDLVAIDLDGTLVVGTTVSEHLSRAFGSREKLLELETAYAAGLISNSAVATETARDLAGVPLQAIHECLDSIPLIQDIRSTVQRLHDYGIHVAIATVTWSFAAHYIASLFNIKYYCGTEMAIRDGILSGEVSRHFDEYDKAKYIISLAGALNIPMSNVAAIGDSRSDIPVFKAVGYSIALNGTIALEQVASVAITSESLLCVLPLLPDKRFVRG